MNVRALLPVLVLAACAPVPLADRPPTVPIPPAPSAAPASPGPPARLSVAAARQPAQVVIDGDLGEWGPRSAAVVLGLDAQALVLAAALGEEAQDGLWLGLGSTPPTLPGIGSAWTNGSVDEIDCDQGGRLVGSRWAPDPTPATDASRRACQTVLEAHARFVSEHGKRFSRRFRVDRGGVCELGEGGALTPVAGARAAWKGAQVEISLPLLALPRVSEAPLSWIGAWAQTGSVVPPEIEAEKARVTPPAPLSFEPHAALRAHALQNGGYRQKWNIQYPSAGQSYQPGDPTHIEYVDYENASVLARHEGLLYEKKATLGDVEVGQVHAFDESLAIFKQGKLLQVVSARPGDASWGAEGDACTTSARSSWRGVIERDGQLHAILQYSEDYATLSCGIAGGHPGGWAVLVIGPDGSHREAVYEEVESKPPSCSKQPCSCGSGELTADEGLTTLGWKGICLLKGRDEVESEVTLRWDAAKQRYVKRWQHRRPAKKK